MSSASESMTFLFHDYETWGAVPARDRAAQFACLRTDADLNPIAPEDVFYCQLSPDYLPTPEACLITGITPQTANQQGLREVDFFTRIHQHVAHPNTCILGYNNVRFDDEVTRYGFYRNFIDPYAYSWQHGNSRWDLLDVVRAFYALRPEGIQWVFDDEDKPVFKLDRLSLANGIEHANAHDAMADVYATIGLARCLKQAQPKLFQFLFDHRLKNRVKNLIDLIAIKPLVHVSGMYSAYQGCVSWVAPIAWHPTNNNAVIIIDLNQDLTPLLDLDADQIRTALYTRKDDRTTDQKVIPLKLVHINKCPVLAPAASLTPERATTLGINRDLCLRNLQIIRQNSGLREKLTAVYQVDYAETKDKPVEEMLYQGFFSDADRAAIEWVHQTSPEKLAAVDFTFQDPRLPRLFSHYKARNYPEILTFHEQEQWRQYCNTLLQNQVEPYMYHLEQLLEDKEPESRDWKIIRALALYLQGQ